MYWRCLPLTCIVYCWSLMVGDFPQPADDSATAAPTQVRARRAAAAKVLRVPYILVFGGDQVSGMRVSQTLEVAVMLGDSWRFCTPTNCPNLVTSSECSPTVEMPEATLIPRTLIPHNPLH